MGKCMECGDYFRGDGDWCEACMDLDEFDVNEDEDFEVDEDDTEDLDGDDDDEF